MLCLSKFHRFFLLPNTKEPRATIASLPNILTLTIQMEGDYRYTYTLSKNIGNKLQEPPSTDK